MSIKQEKCKKIVVVFLLVALFMSLFTSNLLASDESTIDKNSVRKRDDIPVHVFMDELEERESIAINKYNKLLWTWAYNPKNPSDTNADFPNFYGGSYLDEKKELVIKVTILNEEIESYFSEIIDMTNVRFEKVTNSYKELLDVHKFIFEYIFLESEQIADDKILMCISSVDIAQIENAVFLDVYDDKMAENNITADELIKHIKDIVASNMDKIYKDVNFIIRPGEGVALFVGTDATKSTIIEPEEEIEEEYGSSRTLVTLNPGDYIDTNGPYALSVGFWVMDLDNYPYVDIGFITAGHGFHNNVASLAEVFFDGIGYVTIGSLVDSALGGKLDAAYIKCTSTDIVPSWFVPGHNFYLDPYYYLECDNINLPVGSGVIYKRGATTYNTSGTVQSLSKSGKTTSGVSYIDFVSTNCVGYYGDSGGIVAGGGSWSTRYITGIVAFGDVSTSYIIFCKASNIFEKWPDLIIY